MTSDMFASILRGKIKSKEDAKAKRKQTPKSVKVVKDVKRCTTLTNFHVLRYSAVENRCDDALTHTPSDYECKILGLDKRGNKIKKEVDELEDLPSVEDL